MKKRRLKVIMRGVRMAVDPFMAFRQHRPVVRYRGMYESLSRDWYVVGGDMHVAMKKFDSERRSGESVSSHL